MISQWDVAVYDRNEQLVLAVEIKSKIDATTEWAARLRRNILAHGVYPNTPFFLLVLPRYFYLWTQSNLKPDAVAPDYIIDAQPILQPYVAQTGIISDHLSEQSLELIITSWLGEVMYSGKTPNNLGESERWLVDSGLLDAIAGGHFANEVPV